MFSDTSLILPVLLLFFSVNSKFPNTKSTLYMMTLSVFRFFIHLLPNNTTIIFNFFRNIVLKIYKCCYFCCSPAYTFSLFEVCKLYKDKSIKLELNVSLLFFTPQPLMAVGVLFSPMVSGWAGGHASGRAGGRGGGWREIVCPGCISETVRCRKLILGRDIG